ncbi:MAG: hypothetical protein WCI45_00155 [Desulfuromonadales bacterium]
MIDLGVYPVAGEPGRYHVKSSGKTSLLYLVDLNDFVEPTDFNNGIGACGCRDYEVRSGMMLYPASDCKHLRLVKQYRKLQRCFGGARS